MTFSAEIVEGSVGFSLAVVTEKDRFGVGENRGHGSKCQGSIEASPDGREVSDGFLTHGATKATLMVEFDETFVMKRMSAGQVVDAIARVKHVFTADGAV